MRGANPGVLALVVAAGGLATGLALALNYAPTLDAARDSVAYIEGSVAGGRFLRGVHHWAGTFAIVLAALHGARLFWRGAYKAPRRTVWVLGGLVFLVLVGFAYTGYLLAGDERAVTGMGVAAGVAGSTPVVGSHLAAILRGGAVVSSATLVRLYVVHIVVLPAALLGLVVALVAALRRRGHGPPAWRDAAPRGAPATVVVLAALALCAWLAPPGLGRPADPSGGGVSGAKPEWFFLWINELLRIVPGRTFLIAAVLPGVLVALGLGLPWLARGAERAPSRRKPEIAVAALVLAALVGLTASSLASRAEPAPDGAAADEPVAAGAGLDERVAPVLERFRCRACHVIDGGDGTEDPVDYPGPPLRREAHGDRPAFGALYTRAYFRRKVGDPLAFWSETQMIYTPQRRKPTPEQLDLLERWFFGE